MEKQRQLNELETIVTLRLGQINYFFDQCLPADISNGLVFLRKNILALFNHIQKMEQEKTDNLQKNKNDKDKLIVLQKHKKLFQVYLPNITLFL